MKITTNFQEPFATRIWRFELDDMLQYHDQWRCEIQKMIEETPEPCMRSNRLGWNSATTLFKEHKCFKPLHDIAANCFNHIFKEMGADDSLRYSLQGWVNLTHPGGYNVKHVHSQCLMSACYYLDVPENSGNITFHDPRPGAVFSPLTAISKTLKTAIAIPPKSGLLVVFPEWLEHGVEANLSNENRISIPINAVLAKC